MVCASSPDSSLGSKEREKRDGANDLGTGRRGPGDQGRNLRMRFSPQPGEVQHFAPAPPPRAQLAPGLLQPRVSSTPERPSRHTLRGVPATDMACPGGQAAEGPGACSESHGEVGQSRDPNVQPRSSTSEFPSSIAVPPESSLTRTLSPLVILLPVGTQRHYGPPRTSRTKGRKGGCSVLGSGCCLQ